MSNSETQGWSSFEGLGGKAKQIVVGQNQDGRMEVFYVGTNDKIYHNWQTAPNQPFAGKQVFADRMLSFWPSGEIAVGYNQDGRMAVFFRGMGNFINNKVQSP